MKTFESDVKFSGVGVHSGKTVNVKIKPSKKYGIFFKRVDIPNAELIPARYDNVFNTAMNTTVGRAPNCVQTIEHLMAALFIVGVDSAIIEIDDLETPIMDGSSKQFIDLFSKTKVVGKAPTPKIIVKKEVVAYRQELIKKMPFFKRALLWLHNLKTGRRENGYVRLSPASDGLNVHAFMEYPDKQIGTQEFDFNFDGSTRARKEFINDISKSRTFGRFWEWGYLKKRNQGLGANEDNVIVLMNGDKDWDRLSDYARDEKMIKKLSKNRGADTLMPLFWKNEFVRHKIIDALGDMYTSGGFIVGKLESVKGSHGLNNLVLKKLFSDPDNYDIITEK